MDLDMMIGTEMKFDLFMLLVGREKEKKIGMCQIEIILWLKYPINI